MPNHVYTFMTVTGEPEAITAFAEKHFYEGQFDLNTFIKRPECLKGTISPNQPPRNATEEETTQWKLDTADRLAECGFDNWYDWCTTKWGTKWNTYDGDMDVINDKQIKCNFQTAWDLPRPVLEVMAKRYPFLIFSIECVEEGGYFAGKIDIANGIINDHTSAEQWKEYAVRLLGWVDDEEEEKTKERVLLAIKNLKAGEITDLGVVNVMANFVKSNLDDFIEYSK